MEPDAAAPYRRGGGAWGARIRTGSMEAARQEPAVENDGALARAGGGEKSAAKRYRAERIRFWNGYDRKRASAGYYRRLAEVYRYLVPPRSRVLELGCGTGDLLAALEPSLGVGVDFSPQMLERAARKHPQLRFMRGDVDQLSLKTRFDYVILSDLINDLWDVQKTVERLASVCTPATRVIINSFSRLWELPLRMAGRMNLANPALNQNWMTLEDLDNMLALGGFEVVRQWQEVLLPLALPLLGPFCNRYLVKLWPFRHLALTNLIVARLAPQARSETRWPRARGKRNRAGPQRGRQYRECRAARSRNGRRHRDRLRRRPLDATTPTLRSRPPSRAIRSAGCG